MMACLLLFMRVGIDAVRMEAPQVLPSQAEYIAYTTPLTGKQSSQVPKNGNNLQEVHALESLLLACLGWPRGRGSATLVRRHLEVIQLRTLGALVDALGADESKRMHHGLCSRMHAESAYERLGALRGLTQFYTVLSQRALLHTPEAVPFVTELLEDAGADVRSAALVLMRYLEAICGDRLVESQ